MAEQAVTPLVSEALGVLAWLPTDEGEVLGPVGLSGAMIGPWGAEGFVLRFIFLLTYTSPRIVHGSLAHIQIAETVRRHTITSYSLQAGDLLTFTYDMKAHFDEEFLGHKMLEEGRG